MATMAAPPAVVPPVADPSVYIVTWTFASRISCKLMLGGCAFRVYFPGSLASPRAINLVSEGFGQPNAGWVELGGDGRES